MHQNGPSPWAAEGIKDKFKQNNKASSSNPIDPKKEHSLYLKIYFVSPAESLLWKKWSFIIIIWSLRGSEHPLFRITAALLPECIFMWISISLFTVWVLFLMPGRNVWAEHCKISLHREWWKTFKIHFRLYYKLYLITWKLYLLAVHWTN